MQDPRTFAVQAHGDQKYGDFPYVTHLDEVVAILREFGFTTPEHEAVGYLHDVVEDTGTTKDDLQAEFGFIITNAVLFCTDAEGPNRKGRKAATYLRCREVIQLNAALPTMSVPIGVVVKLADRLAHLRACRRTGSPLLQMYLKESEVFRETYCIPGLCDSMWAEYERLVA